MARFDGLMAGLIVTAAIAAAIAASCASVVETGSRSGSSGSGGAAAATTTSTSSASGGDTGGATSTGQGGSGGGSCNGLRELFEQTCKPGLIAECSACHGGGGVSDVPFLGGPDVYATLSAWPGVITLSPTFGLLFSSFPVDGQHPSFSNDLSAKVLTWVKAESMALPPPPVPYHVRMKPLLGALNEISLKPFMSSSLSFLAEESASPEGQLVITHLEVHPSSGISLHVVHPRFVIYPECGAAPIPDPADSLAGVDHLFVIDTDPKLGTGSVILDGWKSGSRLDMSFDQLLPDVAGVMPDGCKALATFQSGVVPALAPCAKVCHSGGDPEATGHMNFEKITNASPTDACAELRMWVTPGDPVSSSALIVADPLRVTSHRFKFAGNEVDYKNLAASMTPWILAEK
jgi:hypothetical protein